MIYSLTRVLQHSSYTVLVNAETREQALTIAQETYGYSAIFEDIHPA